MPGIEGGSRVPTCERVEGRHLTEWSALTERAHVTQESSRQWGVRTELVPGQLACSKGSEVSSRREQRQNSTNDEHVHEEKREAPPPSECKPDPDCRTQDEESRKPAQGSHEGRRHEELNFGHILSACSIVARNREREALEAKDVVVE